MPLLSQAQQSGASAPDYSQYISTGSDGEPVWTGPKYVREGNRMRRGGDILQDYKRTQLYSGYTDDQGNAIAGMKTIYSQGGTTNPNGSRSPQITHTRTTPETHPWLYPKGGQDPMAGKDYSRPDYAPGGIARGFPEIPSMTWGERQEAADRQNFFKTGEGIDPRQLVGMQRVNPRTGGDANRDVFSNEFGTYQMPGWETDRLGNVTFYGARYSGVDAEGNPVDYEGEVPYGSRMQYMTRRHYRSDRYPMPPGGPFGPGGPMGGGGAPGAQQPGAPAPGAPAPGPGPAPGGGNQPGGPGPAPGGGNQPGGPGGVVNQPTASVSGSQPFSVSVSSGQSRGEPVTLKDPAKPGSSVEITPERIAGLDSSLLQGMEASGQRLPDGSPYQFSNANGTFTKDLEPDYRNPYGQNATYRGVGPDGRPIEWQGQYWGYVQQGPNGQTFVPGWEKVASLLGLPADSRPWEGLPPGTNIQGWYGQPAGWEARYRSGSRAA